MTFLLPFTRYTRTPHSWMADHGAAAPIVEQAADAAKGPHFQGAAGEGGRLLDAGSAVAVARSREIRWLCLSCDERLLFSL